MTPKRMRAKGAEWAREAQRLSVEGAHGIDVHVFGFIGALWEISAEFCQRMDAADVHRVVDAGAICGAIRKLTKAVDDIGVEVVGPIPDDEPMPELGEDHREVAIEAALLVEERTRILDGLTSVRKEFVNEHEQKQGEQEESP